MLTRKKILNFPNLILLVLSGINIFLLNLPLTNVLHYEFSATNGILQSFFGGLLAIYFINKNSVKREVQFNVFSSNYKFFLIFTFMQFILAFISNALLQICPLSDGILFYFVITIPAFFIGIILGIFAFSISQRFTYLIFIFIWLLVLLAPLGEIYANPQVYFYNPFIGFFPGTIYDEDIYVSASLIYYRLFNLFFFLILFYSILSRNIYRIKFNRLLRVLVVIIIAVIFSGLKPYLGFSTNIQRLKNELKGEIETEHFLIIYPKDLSDAELNNLVLNHEFAFEELSKELNGPYKSKIISFVFKDGAQKGELFGADNADVAKPWLGQIYVNYTNFRATLQHELAHIFSADYGTTIFKIADSFSPVLIEGFATALAPNYDDNDIHFMARLAYDSGYKVSLESLFSGFNFFGQASSISYIYAGSFMKYLSEKYGIDKFKKLYGELDFEKIFNKKLNELESQYYIFLLSKNFIINKNTANLYFGRKPIFKRFCARLVANQIRKGFDLYEKHDYEKAEQIFSDVYKVSDSYEALLGKSNSLVKLNKEKEALNFVNDEIQKYEGTSYFFNLEVVLGSLFIHNKENGKADSVYSQLLEQAPNARYSDLAFFRKLLLEKSDSSAIKYLKADPKEKLKFVIKLLEEYKYPELVPAYLNISSNQGYNKQKEFLNSLGEDIFSAGSLFEISKRASENNDFEFAAESIIKALKFETSENKKIIYKDYLKKYNWFKNFEADILSTINRN